MCNGLYIIANNGPVRTPIAYTGLDPIGCRSCIILSVNVNAFAGRRKLLFEQPESSLAPNLDGFCDKPSANAVPVFCL
jgi:hypothetical protein